MRYNPEWEKERLSWSSNNAAGALLSPLKLSLAGYRNLETGGLFNIGSFGYYWSSTISGTGARLLFFESDGADLIGYNRAHGYSVRCIKE